MLVGDRWAAVAGPEGAQGLGHSLCAESPAPQETLLTHMQTGFREQ